MEFKNSKAKALTLSAAESVLYIFRLKSFQT